MSNGTKVVKRNGSLESLDLNKLHLMVEEACKDLAGVSASQVEMQSGIQFYDGITTAEVQEILIRSASDLIDLTISLLLLACFCSLSASSCSVVCTNVLQYFSTFKNVLNVGYMMKRF